jgi:hypothetical protein
MKTKSTIAAILFATSMFAQKPSVAVMNIDTKGIVNNTDEITQLVRLELEKTQVYSILDKYEVKEITDANKINMNECYSKTCLTEAGKLLKVEKVLSGTVERFGEKIMVQLRLIDVASATIEKNESTEYINLPEAQKMIAISVKKLVGQTPDQNIVKSLVDYDLPIESPKNRIKLNGPRMGFAHTFGYAGDILTSPDPTKGGFNMYPVTFQFGWQQEFQYISAGNFQALIENIVLVGGVESSRFIPSYTPLLGFRFGKGTGAWEFGFGPTFRMVKTIKGVLDVKGYLNPDQPGEFYPNSDPRVGAFKYANGGKAPGLEIDRLDSRGDYKIDCGLVIALGRTFHSGYLNIPVNAYVAPRKNGTTVGLLVGFNIQKKTKRQ